MVDPIPVPQRLEHAVGKAQRHDVLHCLLAEEVVDAEDLILPRAAQDCPVQLTRRRLVMAKWLLDHHPTPASRDPVRIGLLVEQAGTPQLAHHRAEETIGDGQVEQTIAPGGSGFLDAVQVALELLEQGPVVQVAADVGQALRQVVPGRLVDVVNPAFAGGLPDKALHHRPQAVAPLLRGEIGHVHADQGETLRQ